MQQFFERFDLTYNQIVDAIADAELRAIKFILLTTRSSLENCFEVSDIE